MGGKPGRGGVERTRSRQPISEPRRHRAGIEHLSACTPCYRQRVTRITYAEPRASGVRYRCRGWLMATRHAPIDHTERDLASVQLDALALAHDGLPWAAWKDAVLDWHLQRLAT